MIYGDRRRHVDHSFDQFRFLEVRRRIEAPLKFREREMIAILQWWDYRGSGSVGNCTAHGLTLYAQREVSDADSSATYP